MAKLTKVRADTRTSGAMVKNLIAIGNQLTTEEVAAGVGWYPLAARTARRLGRRYGTTFHRSAGIIAAMSPRQSWTGNITLAEKVLSTREPHGLPICRKRVVPILAGHRPIDALAPTGVSQKVYWFYRAITGDQNAVVIDRWAMRAAMGRHDATEADVKVLDRVGVYEMVADAYRKVAPLFGMTPREFQAAVWVHVRGESQ